MAFQRLPVRARGWLGAKLTQVLGMKGCSLNIFPTGLHKILNASDADVIHLHWVNNEMISIRELAKIKKPVVWTFHDMWPFCGAEHYTNDNRYVTGYQSSEFRVQSSECNPDEQLTDNQQLTTDNRRPLVDVDRWTFLRKQKHWKNWHPYIVTPSNWLADCARQSVLFKNLPVDVIPNCLDLGIFKPMNQQCVRRELNLPENKKLVLFGAYDPSDRRKGGDLLESALQKMNTDEVELVVFGASNGPQIAGMRTHWMGKISDEADLSRLYASVDVLAAPSRMDNLPNTVAEALACGTPVVAFNIGGIPDMVEHQRNGWLAEPFDVADFAKGIEWVLSEDRRSEDRCQKSEVSDWESKSGTQSGNARAKAGALFSESSVAAAYQAVYAKVLAGANS